jgi:dTMP kinase
MPTGLEDLKFTMADVQSVTRLLEIESVLSVDGHYVALQPSKKVGGAFIIIEGPDGVGKTRITKQLTKRLHESGSQVTCTREPSDGKLGRQIREMLRGEIPAPAAIDMSRLYAEDRMDHLIRTVLPSLAIGLVSICDRYLLSSIAYQHGAMGLALSDVLAFNRYAVVPDLTIVLRAPQDVCTARRKERDEAPSMFEDEETQRKIRRVYDNAFDYIAAHNPVFVDASGEFDTVLDACMGHVMSTIKEISQ